MKTPENIYVRLENIGNSWDVSTLDNGGEKYIHKDYVDEMLKTAEEHAYFAGQEKFREKLIEWAKEKLENLKGLLDTDPYKEVYVGQCEVYKELIDKLNSI